MSTLIRFVSIAALIVVVAGVAACAKESGNSDEAKKTDETAKTDTAPAAGKTVATNNAADTAATAATDDDGEGMCGDYEKKEMAKTDGEEAGGCNQWDAEAAEVLKKKIPADATWKTYQVSGMKCGGCERKVIAKIGKVSGVVGVEADAELGQVRIATTPATPKAADEARTALEGLYKVEKAL